MARGSSAPMLVLSAVLLLAGSQYAVAQTTSGVFTSCLEVTGALLNAGCFDQALAANCSSTCQSYYLSGSQLCANDTNVIAQFISPSCVPPAPVLSTTCQTAVFEFTSSRLVEGGACYNQTDSCAPACQAVINQTEGNCTTTELEDGAFLAVFGPASCTYEISLDNILANFTVPAGSPSGSPAPSPGSSGSNGSAFAAPSFVLFTVLALVAGALSFF
eukprot:jgi/Chlat1/3037/Chrsp206S03288